jgi:hypothetical protein
MSIIKTITQHNKFYVSESFPSGEMESQFARPAVEEMKSWPEKLSDESLLETHRIYLRVVPEGRWLIFKDINEIIGDEDSSIFNQWYKTREEEKDEFLLQILKDNDLSYFSLSFANDIYQSYKKDGNFQGIYHYVQYPELASIGADTFMTRTEKTQKGNQVRHKYPSSIKEFQNNTVREIEENIISYWQTQF